MPPSEDDTSGAAATRRWPDPHGHAALLLVESLIHGLCEKAAISVDEAVAIVERAATVQVDHADAADGAATAMWRSHELLAAILASLRVDAGDRPAPDRPAT